MEYLANNVLPMCIFFCKSMNYSNVSRGKGKRNLRAGSFAGGGGRRAGMGFPCSHLPRGASLETGAARQDRNRGDKAEETGIYRTIK